MVTKIIRQFRDWIRCLLAPRPLVHRVAPVRIAVRR